MRHHKTTALRKLSMAGFDLVAGGHNFYALLEFDITGLRSHLRELRREGRGGSLFSFMLKAIGRCLTEFPEFNAMIDYRTTTLFGEVDLNVPIEIEVGGVRAPKQLIIRDIEAKSVQEVDEEIARARTAKDDPQGYVFSEFGRRLLTALPRRLVVALFKLLLRDHARVKRLSGTIFVTSVSMFSNVPGFVIPYIGGPKACSFAIGSAVKKPVVRGSEIVARELINVTAIFNHDLVDGAPASRFINALRDYVERRYAELTSFAKLHA